MAQLLTKQQIGTWLRENNLKTAKSIEDAFTAEIKDVLQEALEEEMTNELGYTKTIGRTRTQAILATGTPRRW